MPKFQLYIKSDLVETLKKLGVSTAFSREADFSGINGARNLCIDNILHQAVFALDEQGVKAAAVTSTSIGLTSLLLPPENCTSFIANRPFLFFLIDTQTNTLLMMGKFQPK